MKRKTTTRMLLIGTVLLGGFILLFERNTENSDQRMRRARTVFAVYPGSIEWILMERDGVQIRCEKRAGLWRMTQPSDAPVDSGIVEKMIAGMAAIERGELITAETLEERNLTPSDYGFDAPRARISFRNNRGTSTWLIGRDAPVGKTLYVMSGQGGDIIAAPQTILDLVPQDPAWIRDRALFSEETSAVRGVDLRRPEGFLQLRQTESNEWMMQQPHSGRADKQAVYALIGKIFSGRILEFVSDIKTDLTAYGLEKPAYELTVFTQDERTQTLMIGSPVPEKPDTLYAKRMENDSVFTVPAGWVQELGLDDNLLRSRQIIALSPERITAVQIIRNNSPVEIVLTNTQWQEVRPARWDADPKQVNQLLGSLIRAAVVEFIDEPTASQKQQIANAPWMISLTADGKTNTLKISETGTNDLRIVQYNDEPSFCTTSAEILSESFADPLFYRDRTVLGVNPAQIENITVKTGEKEQSVKKTETGTFTAGTPGHQLNTKTLTDLMQTLNELRAERYVDYNPTSLKPYGLEIPQATVMVTLSDTNSIGRVVLLGDKSGDGRFAMIQGQDIVFVVSDEASQTLTSELTAPIEKETNEIK